MEKESGKKDREIVYVSIYKEINANTFSVIENQSTTITEIQVKKGRRGIT